MRRTEVSTRRCLLALALAVSAPVLMACAVPPPATDVAPRGDARAGERGLVVRVVDGDTLELDSGETVRLVGIDTPEAGECGFEAAGARLAELTLERRVRLVVSDEDRDRYGRLLRYVDVGDRDAGLVLLSEGLAVARYDSSDGYGFHPREPAYVAADREAPPPADCR